jgi:small-conductance mechanosensitive channel
MPHFLVDALYPLAGLAGGALIGVVLRAAVLPRLAKLAERTETHVDDIVLRSLGGPLIYWAALVGLHAGISFARYEPRVIEAIQKPLLAIVILSVGWTVGGIAAAVVQAPQGANGAIPSARILSTAARAFVFVVGILVALQTLGVSVTPILTALGVGGLAVGLALQDTLANLFAGFQILVSRQVRPGDFIQLATGEQGYVEDITWRNTTIRQLPNNIVIVPNAKLSQQITVNYSLPQAEQSVVMQVGVGYDEDLPRVERITIDVARTVQREVEGAVRDFEPVVRYHTFADSSINFSVTMRGTEFTSGFLMRHEFVKRLHARFRAEGITIPYPQRTVHLRQAQPEPPPRA